VASNFNKRSTAEEVTEGLDLSGKTVLVTGVNSGIGTETMRVMALRGAHVIGTARTLEKASEAAAGVPGTVTPMACELTDQDDIRRCAATLAETAPAIDIVIANAGIMALPKLEQVNGIEKQFAVNHLGHFLLVNLLKDQITAAENARVVVVSSSAHLQAAPREGIQFDNLSGEHGYGAFRAYGQSKLANVLFANGLNQRLGHGATANSLHPGVIGTNLARNMNPVLAGVMGLFMVPFSKSVAQGAATQCYVATSADLVGVAGKYFADCHEARTNLLASDRHLADRLWKVSEELVGLA
jgi:WW domain-containing oxidoreductase